MSVLNRLIFLFIIFFNGCTSSSQSPEPITKKSRKEDYYNLAERYFYNNEYLKAFELFKKAAEDNDARAQYMVGDMLLKGYKGIDKDKNNAKKWLKKSCKRNYAKSCRLLGVIYFNGEKYNDAYLYFQKAALDGDIKSRHNIGIIYLNGYGRNKNEEKAFNYFKSSADKGFAFDQFIVGKMLIMGVGTKKDYKKGCQYLEKAYANNIEEAANYLFILYKNELGCKKGSNDIKKIKATLFKKTSTKYDRLNLKANLIWLELTILGVINKGI